MNFDYLQDIKELQSIYPYCRDTEQYQLLMPEKSVVSARSALEKWVRLVYLVNGWDIPDHATLGGLVSDYYFTTYVADETLLKRIHYIRKVGNLGAHGESVSKKESFFALINLYELIGAYLVSVGVIEEVPEFDKELIPTSMMLTVVSAGNGDVVSTETLSTLSQQQKKPMVSRPVKDDPSEAETRRLYIDLMLREAGWHIQHKEGAVVPATACIEVEVQGMPSESGIGYADYVLFGASGKPLAVVEAKKTTVDPQVGHHQAVLYADCLEKKYGVRPVIYFTNGYETYVVDGLGYPPRRLYSFHTIDDLELLHQKRSRSKITDLSVNTGIAGRDYQIQAIHSLCQRFNQLMRRGLLVMATGTGKTRVSIGLVELLMRNNWAKNVLFLADRTALVNQAAKNYAKLMPQVSTTVLSGDGQPDMQARIMFSTYQTMINYIDREERPFSVGRFDLIIIDEAHRSCYGRYESIFDYFDSLLVGLTATPREDIDHDTFAMLQTDTEDVFAYELEDAINEGNLVGYSVHQRQSLIMSDGIRYDSLSAQEKKQLEEAWEFEKARQALDPRSDYHRDIAGSEIFKVFYNEDTIDKVLDDLMENGLRVNDGDMIGKTIIFAYNQRHAQLIVDRFHERYPMYGDDFCTRIDNSVKYGQNLIDNFSMPYDEAKTKIQIAVSVDMLDTGIDVPDMLNLVFFKQVKSKVKFMQMIGRGTRLCPDVYGPGRDKDGFLIFDWCGNFEYFGKQPKGAVTQRPQSLTERLFDVQLRIAVILQDVKYQEQESLKALHDELKHVLHAQVVSLESERISVRKQWTIVEPFRKEKTWEFVSDIQQTDLIEKVAPLLQVGEVDEMARKWDLIVLQDELSLLDETVNGAGPEHKMQVIAAALEKKAVIPQIKAKLPVIQQLLTPEFWATRNIPTLEYVRAELRDLIKYLVGEKGKVFVIDIEDTVSDLGMAPAIQMQTTYRQKVMDYLRGHLEDDTVLQKIFHLQPLSEMDVRQLEEIFWKELGTREDYEKTYLRQERYKLYGGNIAAFIRSVIGIDREEAIQHFIRLIQTNALTTMQEEYLKKILDYVSTNGDITRQTFAEEPFSDLDWITTFGEHTIDVANYADHLHGIITA